ncbi:hypothetical protein [Streptomyces cadmiisoli]|uniref:Big-1 domain-containing protein n=1 Tax=Streptomyces cadmiisoli TaxID=2184053 RepID=A0A2Z4J0D1_9ACTN|nr:hypothetical protein [Streptomyces cadmiisoli]AWW38520.1 hypothetical protein DN051_19210 [Streptomyces cadmiisoli]
MDQVSALSRRHRLVRGAAALTVAAFGAGVALAGAPAATAADGGPARAGTACTPTAGFEGCRLFDFTGAAVDFQVPAGVTELDVRAWGQGGTGGSMASGGAGGHAAGTVSVTPGEKLSVAVAGLRFGDAIGGKGGGGWAENGGSSSAVRTGAGKPLLVAAGGGGAGGGVSTHGARAGAGGAARGQDAGGELGGKGAEGATGGAGAGDGAAGADHAAGGKGGDGGKGTAREGGGGGGAGYAGGGGGAGAEGSEDVTGGGGGGSSYADPDRVTDVRLLGGDRSAPPAKNDPFWAPGSDPVTSGVAEGGVNAPGGDGRVVLQWDTAAITELSQVSGADQTVSPGGFFQPMAVVARDKDGDPVESASVTYTIEDPDGLGVVFSAGGRDERRTVLTTDAQGRARSPFIDATGAEGEFKVRVAVQGASTVFTGRVEVLKHVVAVVSGDDQEARQGESFDEALRVLVTESGAPVEGRAVEFRVEGDSEDGPRFEGEEQSVHVETDASGKASAPALVAGRGTGTYTVVATVGGASTGFTLVVLPGADPTDPAEPTDPAGPSDPADGGTGGTEGTSGGNTAAPAGGSLAETGTGALGTLLGLAAALAAVGAAACRFGPRRKQRFQTRG